MGTRGPLVRLKAKAGKMEEVEGLLRSTLSLFQQEPGTLAQFAVRFSPSEHGTAGLFPADAEREAHPRGAVARAFMNQVNDLFEGAPSIHPLDELANKLPKGAAVNASMGSSLRLKLRAHHKRNVDQFLHDTAPPLPQEEKTDVWFAIRTSDGEYGLFEVFPDNAVRSAHLTGHVPGEFVKHAFALLGNVPNPAFLPASSLQPDFGTFQ